MTRTLLVSLLCLCLTGLMACTNRVAVQEKFPVPVMQKHPFQVVLHLEPALTGYVHDEVLEGEADWEVNFGRANVVLFQRVMAGMFKETLTREGVEPGPLPPGSKAVIKPVMEDYQLSTPKQSKTKYYEVWIKYRLQVYNTEGSLVEDWPFTAYGRNRAGMLGAKDSLNEATRRAMRDAATAVVLDFMKQRKIQRYFYGDKGRSQA